MKKGAKKHRVTAKFLAIIGVVAACFICAIVLMQESKLAQIRMERAKLEAEFQLLQNEEQRVENMLKYVHSEEYLLQYAREKLGFVKPEDIKFSTTD